MLLSTVGQTHGQIGLYGGTKDGLSLDDVKNYQILLPPPDEQSRPSSSTSYKATANIDSAIARAHRQIELLQEYHTRLIADVVTGKLDVREAAARLPGEARRPGSSYSRAVRCQTAWTKTPTPPASSQKSWQCRATSPKL